MKNFIIYTYPFNINIGGVKVLHKLCDLLNKVGQKAYLYPVKYPAQIENIFILNTEYNTPIITQEIKNNLDDCIVIYPEIIKGNPLNAKNVVRWILNNPSAYENTYGKNDIIFYYSKLFYSNLLKNEENILTILEYHTNIFKNYNLERNLTCYLIRKAKNPKFIHPKDSIEITWDDCGDLKKLVNIFNKSKYLYSYDDCTFTIIQAAMCGCIPIILPDVYNKKFWMDNSIEIAKLGVAYGNDENEIEYAKKTQPLLLEKIKELENDFTQLNKFINMCQNKLN